MTDNTPRPFKYRAFLSYSHADHKWGEWLHHEIETYQVPRDLVGRSTARGKISGKIRPIFRDRFDLEAGHSLTEQVTSALDNSQALLVICSPASARSPYVNEEIRLFKALGRADQVYPLIVDGEPGDAERECFPPMLRAVLDATGQPSGETLEPIAADARDVGDGRDLALLKLIAGLIGVDLDELRRREAVEQRRRLRRTRLVAGAMGFLAIGATGAAATAYHYYLDSNQQRQVAEAERQTAIAERDRAVRLFEAFLTNTVRSVITTATKAGGNFPTEMVATKEVSDDFQIFMRTGGLKTLVAQNDDWLEEVLKSRGGRDYVWLRLSQELLNFAKSPPFELQQYRKEREWLRHAQRIMRDVVRRPVGERPEYRDTLNDIEAEMRRQGA